MSQETFLLVRTVGASDNRSSLQPHFPHILSLNPWLHLGVSTCDVCLPLCQGLWPLLLAPELPGDIAW